MGKQSILSLDTIILVGGKGTRLSTVVQDLPKPLAPVAGKPFLDYLVNFVKKNGINGNIIISAGYKAAHVRDWAKSFPVNTIIVEETVPLGTGGAVLHALDNAAETDTVLIMNGDSWIDTDLADMARFHKKSGCNLTIAVTEVSNVSQFGEVKITNGQIHSFIEKGGDSRPGYINAGIYMAKRQAFDQFPRGSLSFERDIIPKLLDAGVNTYLASGSFIDIGTPESYAQAADILKTA